MNFGTSKRGGGQTSQAKSSIVEDYESILKSMKEYFSSKTKEIQYLKRHEKIYMLENSEYGKSGKIDMRERMRKLMDIR